MTQQAVLMISLGCVGCFLTSHGGRTKPHSHNRSPTLANTSSLLQAQTYGRFSPEATAQTKVSSQRAGGQRRR